MARPSARRPNNNGAGSTARPRRLPGRQVGVFGPDAGDRRPHPDPTPAVATEPDEDFWDHDGFDGYADDRQVGGARPARAGRRTRGDRRGTRQPQWRDRSDRRERSRRDDRPDRAKAARGPGRGLGTGLPAGLRPSDATIARVSAAALWALVLLAAYGGLTSLAGSSDSTATDTTPPAPGEQPDGRWAAAGFAERYLTAYLAAGADGSGLGPYLGYTPELPPTAEPTEVAGPARTVDVALAEEGTPDYWSVTVAVGGPGGSEAFWQAAVDTSGDQPVAVGLPAPVAGPAEPDRVSLDVTLSQPPADDPMVESVEGFLAAYLCGAPDLDRYLHPELALQPADPAVCSEVEVERWGATAAASADGDGASPTDERQTVVAEVVLDSGERARSATYGLTLAQRDGRWEIAELLPAPPTKER